MVSPANFFHPFHYTAIHQGNKSAFLLYYSTITLFPTWQLRHLVHHNLPHHLLPTESYLASHPFDPKRALTQADVHNHTFATSYSKLIREITLVAEQLKEVSGEKQTEWIYTSKPETSTSVDLCSLLWASRQLLEWK